MACNSNNPMPPRSLPLVGSENEPTACNQHVFFGHHGQTHVATERRGVVPVGLIV